jgi:hypothetical protein
MQEEQEGTQEKMRPLVDFLKSRRDLAVQQQLSAGLESFQVDLLRTLAAFMSKKEPKADDREIVSQGLSIWMSCIASEPKLLNQLYSDFARLSALPSDQAAKNLDSSLYFSSILVEKGLLSSDYKMREAFASAIRFVVESIQSSDLQESPLLFFLRLLLGKLDYVQHKASSRHAKLYFLLLRELLPQYLAALRSASTRPQ